LEDKMEWDDVMSRVKATRADGAYLATVGADGRPHVAWVAIGYGDQTLWAATFRSSQKAANLRHHPEVALHWQEHTDHLVFARARARLVDDPAETRRLWGSGTLPYDVSLFWPTPDDPELQFVELVPHRVSIIGADHTAPPDVWVRAAA
jgi:general stress protein 26